MNRTLVHVPIHIPASLLTAIYVRAKGLAELNRKADEIFNGGGIIKLDNSETKEA